MIENPLNSTIEFMPPVQRLLHEYLQPLIVKWFETQYQNISNVAAAVSFGFPATNK